MMSTEKRRVPLAKSEANASLFIQIEALPQALIVKIVSHLGLRHLAAMSGVCWNFRTAAREVENGLPPPGRESRSVAWYRADFLKSEGEGLRHNKKIVKKATTQKLVFKKT